MSAELRSLMGQIVYNKPAPMLPQRPQRQQETVATLIGVPGAALRKAPVPGYKRAPPPKGQSQPYDKMKGGVHGGAGCLPGQQPNETRRTGVHLAAEDA